MGLGIETAGRSGELDEFSAGLSSEISTLLSYIRWISLIDEQDIGADHPNSAPLLFDGSIRASGDRLRVQFQIKNENRLIANKQVEAQLSDPFATQEELANDIASQVEAAILIHERDRILADQSEKDTAWGNFILGYAEAAKNDLNTYWSCLAKVPVT